MPIVPKSNNEYKKIILNLLFTKIFRKICEFIIRKIFDIIVYIKNYHN